MTDIPAPDYDDFANRVGAHFQVEREPGQPTTLTLVACSPPVRNDGYLSYSIDFRGSSAEPLGQGTWEFSADEFGPEFIFIVPVRASNESIEYQAVFTHREE